MVIKGFCDLKESVVVVFWRRAEGVLEVEKGNVVYFKMCKNSHIDFLGIGPYFLEEGPYSWEFERGAVPVTLLITPFFMVLSLLGPLALYLFTL